MSRILSSFTHKASYSAPVLAAALASASFVQTSNAALLGYEPWEYGASTIRFYTTSTGPHVEIGTTGNGFTGGWVAANTADPGAANDAHAYRNLASPTITGVTTSGGLVMVRASGSAGPTRDLASTISEATANSFGSDTIWVSAFMRLDNSNRIGDLNLLNNGVEAVGLSFAGTNANLNNISAALRLRGAGGTTQTLANQGNLDWNFFLMSIEYGDTLNTLSLWNATALDLDEPLPAATLSLTSETDWAFNGVRITMNSNTSNSVSFDEIRIGTTLQNVLTGTTVVPEPSSLALLGLGGVALLRRRQS